MLLLTGVNPAAAHPDDPLVVPVLDETDLPSEDDLLGLAAELSPYDYVTERRVLAEDWAADGSVLVYTSRLDFSSPLVVSMLDPVTGIETELVGPYASQNPTYVEIDELVVGNTGQFAVAWTRAGVGGSQLSQLVRWDLSAPTSPPVVISATPLYGRLKISDNGLFVVGTNYSAVQVVDTLNGSVTELPGTASAYAISGDGRWVYFVTGQQIDPGDTDFEDDAYSWDRLTGTTTWVSQDPIFDSVTGITDLATTRNGGKVAVTVYDPPAGVQDAGFVPVLINLDGNDDGVRGDLATATLPTAHEGFRSGMDQLSISPEGRYVSYYRHGSGAASCTANQQPAQTPGPELAAASTTTGVNGAGSAAFVLDLDNGEIVVNQRVKMGWESYCGGYSSLELTVADEAADDFDLYVTTAFPTPSLTAAELLGVGRDMHEVTLKQSDYSLCQVVRADGVVVDSDGDCLSDSNEALAGSNPNMTDTDGDQLLDSWEVHTASGGVIRLPDGSTTSPEQVFYDTTFDSQRCLDRARPLIGSDGKIDMSRSGTFKCLNEFPDPTIPDLYYELDWQDCLVRNSCPAIEQSVWLPDLGWDTGGVHPIVLSLDPNHHGPDLEGLELARETFDAAGIRLNVVVQKGTRHFPYCFEADDPLLRTAYRDRRDRFSPFRANVYRLIYSGHSTYQGECTYGDFDSLTDLAATGLNLKPLPAFDTTPFGDASIGGFASAVSEGIPWICSTAATPNGRGFSDTDSALQGILGVTLPTEAFGCFRHTIRYGIGAADDSAWWKFRIDSGLVVPLPGIYPAVAIDSLGQQMDLRWPTTFALGETEADATTQMWARGLTHLVLHNMGYVSDDLIGNYPAPTGRVQPDSTTKLGVLAPTWPLGFDAPSSNYGTSFVGLYSRVFRPQREGVGIGAPLLTDGVPTSEPGPDLAALMADDPDGDGVATGDDNCPTVYNPGNAQSHWSEVDAMGVPSPLVFKLSEFGDACNRDADGDGEFNIAPSTAGARLAPGAAALAVSGDPYPNDFDNDGIDDDVDADLDNDSVTNDVDNCVRLENPGQADIDGDGVGDACDLDADDDGVYTIAEAAVGSDPFNAASQPEITRTAACSDGIDNDLDGTVDSADLGCVNQDGDIFPDSMDLCPSVANTLQTDFNDNGVGDQCEPEVLITNDTGDDLTEQASTDLTIVTSQPGTLQVRVDAVGCDGGTLLYDAPITETATVTVNATDLTSTETRVEACVTAGSGWGSSVIYLTGGTTQRTTLLLAPFADTGVSNADGLTAARELTFHGLAAPDATVELLADSGVVATTQADFFGEFAFDVAPPADGQHAYTAVTSSGVASAPVNITYVSTGPIVTVTPPGANPQNISYSTDATSEACYLNTVPVPCGSPVDVSFLGDGEHVFQMEAYNDAGAVTLVQQAFTKSIAIGQPPIANNDTAETESGEAVVVDVLANDTDPDNDLDPGSLSVLANPTNGAALVVGDPLEGLEIEYEPTPGFAGIDQFDYQVCDLEGSCASGTVTVTVLASASPPDAVDDKDEAETDETVTIDVLENDSDPDDDINDDSLTIITAPGNGTAIVVTDPADGVAIDYTPATGFSGTDSFTYQICDDTGLCDTATVTILVGSASCTIIGTSGDDTLNGTEGDDIICGLGGDDVINGGGGNDIIRGGRGADTLNGQAGNDTIYGGNGGDTIKGQAGDDQIYGGRGADSLDGGNGNDTIRGNRGADTITGGAGDDTLYSGAGNDTIDGGNGADIIRGYRGADILNGGGGADAIYGGRGADVIHGDDGPDLLRGRRGADTLFGDDGNDEIYGEKGPDTIDGGSGRDSVYGGDGGDSIQGGPGADNMYGRQGADSLDGGPGNDLANGGPGNDSCVAETRKQCES